MAIYLVRRVGQAIAVLWAAFTVSFVVLYLLPSDPVSLAADVGVGVKPDPAAIAEMQARYGLDKPLWEQYATALGNAVTGDLGRSISTGQPVTKLIADAVASTLALASLALVFAVIGGGALALFATHTRRPWLRDTLSALPSLGVSIPNFWTGLLLLQVFSFGLHWFPAFGGTGLRGTLLPAITLAIPTGAVIAQVLIASITNTWRQPFAEVAVAKGGSRWWVQRRHVARLASIPALTIAGVIVGNMLAGSVVAESVFARAGVGRVTQTAVMNQDIPVVQGVVLLSAVVFVSVNLLVDLVYPLLDPRITAATGGAVRWGFARKWAASRGAKGALDAGKGGRGGVAPTVVDGAQPVSGPEERNGTTSDVLGRERAGDDADDAAGELATSSSASRGAKASREVERASVTSVSERAAKPTREVERTSVTSSSEGRAATASREVERASVTSVSERAAKPTREVERTSVTSSSEGRAATASREAERASVTSANSEGVHRG
ncbi:hypothetical protein GCM10011591_42940 [Nocardia camponoti]|uniref:ABC transmembrane type-1 domain-containing protein n=1 Tax=Nocardia camponoti TaxID=1616106 RepID=A0A917QTC1_9NOCA|nr:hypothetical protein GCM10011591_42940 [Nocardia camponoti]